MRSRCRVLLQGAVMLALATQAPVALARPDQEEHLERAIKLLHDMEDQRALLELRSALKQAEDTRSQARIYVYIGIAQLNLLRTDQARESFRAALRLDRAARLPAMTSPKIQEVFEELRRELGRARPHPAPPSTTPAASRPPPTAAVRAPEEPAPARADRGLRRLWPAFATLGLAAAAGLAGMSCGLLSRSSEEEAGNIKLSYGEAREHHDAAISRALAANVLLGVAGAAALASGVLFLVMSRRSAAPSRAALLPLRSGAAVQVGLSF